MKRKLSAYTLIFCLFALVCVLLFYLHGNRQLNKSDILMRGTLPSDFAHYTHVPLEGADSSAILECKQTLIAKGLAKRSSDISLMKIAKKQDGSSTLYFFRQSDFLGGPTYVIRVDNVKSNITEMYLLPDA